MRPGIGSKRQNDRLGVEKEQKTAPPPPAAASFAVPFGDAPDWDVIHTYPNLKARERGEEWGVAGEGLGAAVSRTQPF